MAASGLLNTKLGAIGASDLNITIEKARKYYENCPYPTYGTWPVGNDGNQVYPKVIVPIPRVIVNKSATFLMKRPPRFYVKDNPAATDFIRKTVDDNTLDFVSDAQTAGIEGGIWLKFLYDGLNKRRPWQINVMGVEEVIPVYNPHDLNDLQMVRVQYEYLKSDGTSWWYREEWTDYEYVVYQELPSEILNDREALEHAREGGLDEDTGPWRVAWRKPNQFAVIPFQLIKNLVDPLNPNGKGDYWELFDLFDRINVAYNDMDISNQFGAGPVTVFTEADNAPAQLTPHESYSISGPNAKVDLLENKGLIRPYMQWYAEKLETMAYSAVGIVNPKLEDVAGLGQLSYAALQLLHGPLIEYSDRKREYWGARGLALFFEKMLRAASRWDKKYEGAETMEVITEWPDYFPLGGVDKQIEIANIKTAIEIGLPIEYGVTWLAKVVGITEEELSDFLQKAQADAEARKILTEAAERIKSVGNNVPGLQNQSADGSKKGAARKSK